jgi:hypothetical protein
MMKRPIFQFTDPLSHFRCFIAGFKADFLCKLKSILIIILKKLIPTEI